MLESDTRVMKLDKHVLELDRGFVHVQDAEDDFLNLSTLGEAVKEASILLALDTAMMAWVDLASSIAPVHTPGAKENVLHQMFRSISTSSLSSVRSS